jgi:hypothetical protein
MAQNFVTQFCREHHQEFKAWTRTESLRVLELMWIMGVLLFLMNYLNYRKASSVAVALAYVPAATLLVVGAGMARFRPQFLKNGALWLDLASLFTAIGGGVVMAEYLRLGLPVVNAPAQIILIVTGLFNVRTAPAEQMSRLSALVLCLILPFVFYEESIWSYLHSLSFRAQVLIGALSSLAISFYIARSRESRFYAEVMREHERIIAALKYEKDAQLMRQEFLRQRIASMVAVADGINSPITTLRALCEFFPEKLNEIESQSNDFPESAKESIRLLQGRTGVFFKTVERLSAISAEVNTWREFNVEIDEKLFQIRADASSMR